MSFVRSKVINGCGPYYYKVENRWVPGKGSRQKVIRYLGPGGDDGVVKYSSAYITGVESVLVVRSGHCCQGNPATIEEVRRILLEHLRKENQSNRP